MMRFTRTDKIGLIGRSGCGKSYLGRLIQKIYPRRVIFDRVNEYPADPTDIYTFDQFKDFARQANSLQSFQRVIRFPKEMDRDQKNHLFEIYMAILYEIGNLTIVVEEAQDYCHSAWIGENFKLILTSGRHRDISLIFTTQRPALVNNTLYSQSTHIFAGNLIAKGDANTMADLMDKKRSDFNTLKRREFLWFCPDRDPHTIKISTDKSNIDIKKG